ncbi:molybdopterin-dependent oxidoreductase [Hyphomicrobium sp.]|jgi:DMSO/TMAO reductase YedYZ molybdopterin-dependent catalytic subunit|uniref:molybdopterin-dependent oxidoreductase n=1 Tax=Hyphomicrobium sp. TaxID=82 RepID=UPI003564CA48
MNPFSFEARTLTRRAFLGRAALGGAALMSAPAWAHGIDFPFPGGFGEREMTTSFPQKGSMILQRTRPPLLETPWETFDRGVFTTNDQFYVRWHWAGIPDNVDVNTFRLKVHGNVDHEMSLALPDLIRTLPRVELAAVNQCSGNSRGFFSPRVPGAQWANGAMGNAMWAGFRLKDLLDSAGVKAGSTQVRFSGLEEPVIEGGPHFKKSLTIDHARDGEVMVAYAMNGEALPFLNGFPLRLIVPGWYATYWMKMLADIEVLNVPDDNFWTKKAYLIPDTPRANIIPGETGVKMVPINRMVPRSFVTNLSSGASIKASAPNEVRGIAFGGDCGVAKVDMSVDGGANWQATELGPDEGKYGFRRWSAKIAPPNAGSRVSVAVRCTNTNGDAQPDIPNWNPSGFMRNVIETVDLVAA